MSILKSVWVKRNAAPFEPHGALAASIQPTVFQSNSKQQLAEKKCIVWRWLCSSPRCFKLPFRARCYLGTIRPFSPPTRWGLLDFIRVVLLLLLLLFLLLRHLCLHFHVHFRLANSSPSSSPSSARSGHCWTSTARVWAHWAPLDVNLGPSELSEHRWTSTWDPPSSVSTAGPQPGTLRAQWAPLDLNGQIECQKICQIERQIECQKEVPGDMPDKVPECLPDRMPEDMPDRMPEGMPDRMSDRMPEGMPDKVPECLPR